MLTTYPETYPPFVAQLSKPGREILDSLDPDKAHLAHAVFGLTGELGELVIADINYDTDNVLEEVGDLFFYCRMIRNCLSIEPHPTGASIQSITTELFGSTDKQGTFMEVLVAQSHNIVDALKRFIFYARPLTPNHIKQLNRDLTTFELILGALLESHGHTIKSCVASNMDKLLERFPKAAYSNKDALSRKDKTN